MWNYECDKTIADLNIWILNITIMKYINDVIKSKYDLINFAFLQLWCGCSKI